jgi:RNA polymerase sigma-70 factor (ECF subfamily)
MPNDEVLISRFQRGESEAFDRLMSLHANKVFALAWGVMHNREDAVDAVQEVFIRLHKALPGMSPTDNLSAWLYRVCLNHCIDRRRRHKNAPSELTDEDWDRLQGPDVDQPEEITLRMDQSRIIRTAVDHLPEKQRIVFVLRHYRLMSISEIADALECSVGAVKAHQSRATANLRLSLKGIIFPLTTEVDRK